MNPLLKITVDEAKNLYPGEKFLLKDLFKGYVWSRFDRATRINLGTLFLNEVKNNPSLEISILDKTSSNQQKYMKN